VPTDDELLRLLDAYRDRQGEYMQSGTWGLAQRQKAVEDACTALLAYIEREYVRRDDPRYRILDRASEALVTFGGLRSTRCADCGAHILVKDDDAVDLCDGCVTRRIHHGTNRLPASPPGSYKEARGVVPWKTGNELPEVAIRRLRDGDDG